MPGLLGWHSSHLTRARTDKAPPPSPFRNWARTTPNRQKERVTARKWKT